MKLSFPTGMKHQFKGCLREMAGIISLLGENNGTSEQLDTGYC